MKDLRAIATFGLIVLWSAGLWAQSDLAALQKKEKERRKKTKPSMMVINDESRAEKIEGKGLFGVMIIGKDEETSRNDAAMESSESQETVAGMDKESWVNRWRQIRDEVAQLRERVEDVRKRIDSLVSARINESNPLKYQEHTDQIQILELSLIEETEILASKEKEFSNFLVQARRDGVPPGWFRE